MSSFRRAFLHHALTLLAIGLLTTAAIGQATTGDLTGRVVDEKGNVVPNATVTARNAGTGLSRTAQTNEEGDYTVTLLPAGVYELTAEAQGFGKVLRKDIQVTVGSRQTLNIELRPGPVTGTVDVTTDNTLVETTRSDISGVVTPQQVQNLPLLNRTFASLSVIMPEARPVGSFDPTKTRVGNIALNGGDGR